MRSSARALASLGALLLSLSANAAIYKCIGPDGRVEFQDVPCVGKSGGDIAINPNVVSEIDQSASAVANRTISDRLNARARADAYAQRRADFESAPMRVYSSDDSPAPVYYYPSYPYHRRPIVHRHRISKAPPSRTVPATPAHQRIGE